MQTSKSVRSQFGRGCFSALLTLGLIVGALAAPSTAQAQSKGDVVVSLVAQRVSKASDGKEILAPADRAFPGEVVQYDAHYRNTSDRGVRNLEPTLPIPAGLEFLLDSAKPAPAQASVDGRTFAPFPLMRKVTRPDGTVEEQPVPPAEYRALRWSIGDLPAGEAVTVSARARLSVTASK
jgi:uncharacterized repeat protein (TIGR01451 family)